MKKGYFFLLSIFSLNTLLLSFPIQFNQLNKELNDKSIQNPDITSIKQSKEIKSSVGQILSKNIEIPIINQSKIKNRVLSSDTLFIGWGIKDTLIIENDKINNGPIIVGLNGYLKIRNCNFTQLGDIYIMLNGKIEIENSNIYMPQSYFYQRSILLVNDAILSAKNTNFNYSGLSHNIIIYGNSIVDFNNINNYGFTTTSMAGKAKFLIDKINEAGEFVITDSVTVDIKNSKTALLWHVIKNGASFDISFPNGAAVNEYKCNSSINGIKGIDYSINIQNSSDIMWALMPENGSNVKITDSDLRAIGLWYRGNENSNLKSITNNTYYKNLELDSPDRSLKLVNSSVKTWNIYTFDNSRLNITNAIVGEIGSMGKSSFMASQSYCDGTGGYMWSSDTSFAITGFSSSNTAIRSQGYSIYLFAYSSVNSGELTAVGNSNLIVLQSTIPEDPYPLEKSTAWYGNIESPSKGYNESIIPIKGSAWIDAGPLNEFIKFDSYKIEFRLSSDTIWKTIVINKNKIRHNILANWNTAGLIPDQYVLKLTLYNNLLDSIECVKAINILPKILGIGEVSQQISISPNPASDYIEIYTSPFFKGGKGVSLEILNIFGEKNLSPTLSEGEGDKIKIDISNLPAGIYFLKVGDKFEKFIKL